MSTPSPDVPSGDVVDTRDAMHHIEEALGRLNVQAKDARYQISGTAEAISWEAARRWMAEAEGDGFSRLRFVIHLTSEVPTVEISAISIPSLSDD
jgi:hypothetical protein